MVSATQRIRDWSALPPELLQKIAGDLFEIADYARFRAVCAPWRSAAAPANLRQQLPLLFPIRLPTEEFHIYTLTAADLPLHLPDFGKMFMSGSAHGWLLAIDRSNPSASLLNPLTRARIPLPPFPERWPPKRGYPVHPDKRLCISHGRIVSSSASDWTVMICLNDTTELLFLRAGDTAWRKTRKLRLATFFEFSYFKGRVFIAGINGKTTVSDAATLRQVCEFRGAAGRPYLVESPFGGLFLLFKRYDEELKKHWFEVYELDDTKELRWVRVTSIGDCMLFVDDYKALSLPSNGWGRNVIFFVQRSLVWAFNMEDASVEQILHFEEISQAGRLSTYGWVVPTLC